MYNKFTKAVMDLCSVDYDTIKSILEIYEPNLIVGTDSEHFKDLQSILHSYYNKAHEIDKELSS